MTVSDIVQREIRRGERVVWSGQPIQGVRLQANDWFLTPFTLMWALLPAVAATDLIRKGGLVNLLIASFCALLVIGVVFARFFVDAWLRAHHHYVVTDQRVLSIADHRRIRVESVLLCRLASCSVIVHRSGTGLIVFGSLNPFQQTTWPYITGALPPSFKRIPDAHRVFQFVVSTLSSTSKPRRDSTNEPVLNSAKTAHKLD